jgi:hypothetical protein
VCVDLGLIEALQAVISNDLQQSKAVTRQGVPTAHSPMTSSVGLSILSCDSGTAPSSAAAPTTAHPLFTAVAKVRGMLLQGTHAPQQEPQQQSTSMAPPLSAMRCTGSATMACQYTACHKTPRMPFQTLNPDEIPTLDACRVSLHSTCQHNQGVQPQTTRCHQMPKPDERCNLLAGIQGHEFHRPCR